MSSIFQYYKLIEQSGLFDPGFYVRAYPEVARSNLDPLTHFLEIGAREGRNPSAGFDTGHYLRECRRLGLVPDNPLVHYLREGLARGLRPLPGAVAGDEAPAAQAESPDIAAYLAAGTAASRRTDALAAEQLLRLWQSPFIDDEQVVAALGGHKAAASAAELYLRLPIAARPTLSAAFDRAFYLAVNDDVAAARLDPLIHFLVRGCQDGRSPHPLVDPAYIRLQDPSLLPAEARPDELWEVLAYDLADPGPYFRLNDYRAQLSAGELHVQGLLLHFLVQGCQRGLRPNRLFDPRWYGERLAPAQDMHAAIRHFVLSGDREGRSPSVEFSSTRYLQRYQDVAAACLPPLLHYLTSGEAEARPIFGEPPPPLLNGRADADWPAVDGSLAAEAPTGQSAIHAAMRRRLEAARQRIKDAVAVHAPGIVRLGSPRIPLGRIRLPREPTPTVSILIPAFDEPRCTAECLLSLVRSGTRTPYEVILADDASTDPELQRLARVPNLVYVRQPSNVGFLENCNRALAHCRGQYVLLLNNDAQLLPGALDALVAELQASPEIAAVGPKILYPDGRLQEAGCAIDRSGVSTMIGLFADPDLPQFNHPRDVFYCSGAALLVRRSELDARLFDPAYAPAYCEDADLCLALIARGRRVRYCPAATVIHHLSVSSNRQSLQRRLQLVTRNQQRLATRWPELLERLTATRVICFYLPQFHPTPENDFHWGRGFTEWTNVTRARPCYQGHYQPHLPADLGFYDLRVRQSVQRQAELARRYGIAGFCVYYYNFGSQRALHEAFEAVVADRTIDFPFMLCWANENWTRHWDGGTRQIIFEQRYDEPTLASVLEDAVRHARDPRYLTVDGRPMFAVYRPLLIPDLPAFVDRCRRHFREAGFDGVHLMYVDGMETATRAVSPASLGFDACVEFPPHGHAVELQPQPEAPVAGFAGRVYDYEATLESCIVHRRAVPDRYPGVFPGWDNTPRQPRKGDSFPNSTPEAFQVYVEEKLDEVHRQFVGERRMLFVNAWNEWAEGAHLEPDQRFGHRWLEAIRNALLSRQML